MNNPFNKRFDGMTDAEIEKLIKRDVEEWAGTSGQPGKATAGTNPDLTEEEISAWAKNNQKK